jgi:hypothetical protein
MRKPYIYTILACAAAIAILYFATNKGAVTIENYSHINRAPSIRPDYTETVIPPNIAPLNFIVLEPGTRYLVKIYSSAGEQIDVFSRTGKIKIPLRQWRSLLNNNRGKQLYFDIYVKSKDGLWSRYKTITNSVANEDVDGYLVYRFIKPLFNWWYSIGVYQRNLENYENRVVLHGKSFSNGCLNCHTFLNNKPERMTLGIRSATYGSATLLASDGKARKIGAKWGYTAWHPSGRLATYSMNKVQMFFHKTTEEIRDVVDLDSALCYYLVDSQKIKTAPGISEKDRLETYPTWSPDGQYLYFCSAPILWEDRNKLPPERYAEVKYDLRRISYNVDSDKWGQPETVLSAKKTNMSILLPRISPDGRFLVFCMCDYGCFPVYQPSSDLYLMDLKSGKYDKLPINSKYSESWHSFSSNSRWLAFSSKRRDGLFTRTYFSYIDENGRGYKPFILPQKNPAYYDSLLQAYSVPELVTSRVEVSKVALARAARGPAEIAPDIPLTGATIKAGYTEDPWRDRE